MSSNMETDFFLGAMFDFDGNNEEGNLVRRHIMASIPAPLPPDHWQAGQRSRGQESFTSTCFYLYSATIIMYWKREVTYPAIYHPPLAPFFFFCCCFFLEAGAPAGFWCLGGITLLVVDTAAPLPGRGEVGGLLAVLLASLQGRWEKEITCGFTTTRKM